MLQQLDDYKLVELYSEGNDKAFEVLFERYSTNIYSFIISKVTYKELANDLYQETFVKVINSIRKGKYSPTGKFLSWIFRIANNIIIDHFRRSAKFSRSRFHTDNDYNIFNYIKDPSLNIESQIIKDQMENIGKQYLSRLSEDQRTVVIMRIYKNMSFKEIAEQTDVNINTALGRMRYALKNLKTSVNSDYPNWM